MSLSNLVHTDSYNMSYIILILYPILMYILEIVIYFDTGQKKIFFRVY